MLSTATGPRPLSLPNNGDNVHIVTRQGNGTWAKLPNWTWAKIPRLGLPRANPSGNAFRTQRHIRLGKRRGFSWLLAPPSGDSNEANVLVGELL